MKKVLLIASFFLILTSTVHAQTREELAAGLVDIFDLQNSTYASDMSGLYFHSDWLQISRPLRESVSIARQSGIFVIPKGQFRPQQDVDSDDIKLAKRGLDMFVFFSDNYSKALGTVRSASDTRVVITLDSGATLEFRSRIPFLTDSGIKDSAALKAGDLVCLVLDENGNIVFIWEQRHGGDANDVNNYEVVAIRRGSLFLYDHVYSDIIVATPEERRFGRWVNLGLRYDNFPIHDNARFTHNRRDLARNRININWLDLNADYVLGINRAHGDSPKVLHVSITN
jgi:hypothetical protein